jgi:hypothetical protein
MNKLSDKERGCYWCRFRKKLFCSRFKNGEKKNIPLTILSINVLRVEELKNSNCGKRCWGFERIEKEKVSFT